MDQLIEQVEEIVNKLEQELELRLTELKMLKTKRDADNTDTQGHRKNS